ncbi:MAG: hypothetical protein LBD01_00220, partial [Puniceicoccales bacterium]|nr:hypothetical protein [Puniceicoccales bacterium]
MTAAAILLGGDTGGTVNITGDAAEIRGNITGSGAGQHTVNFAPGTGNFHAYTGTLNAIANINIQSGEVALSQVVGAGKIEVSPDAGLLMDSAPESAELALNGTFTLTLDDDDTLFAVLTGGGDFTKTGDGTLTLSETSDAYTGTLVLAGGGLEIDNGAELGDPASGGGLVVGSGTAAGISGTLNGGLVFSNAGTSALVQLRRGEINANASGEAVIFDSGDGTLKITSHQGNVNGDIVARNASAGLVQVDLGSRFGALDEFLFDGNILAEGSATIALDVVSGALHLSGTGSDYAGTTTVRDGAALYADNAAGSATGVSRVLVENGGVLAGTGKISGDGNNNGILISGIISPGATEGDVGELTFNGATRFTNATLAVDIAPGTHDTLVINDTLTLSGTANKVRVNADAPLGVHDIVTASSISGYAQDSFEKITGTASDGYSLTRGSGVVLDETITPTLRLVLSTDDALELTWTGATDATWINAPTADNWTSADGHETQYRDGDSVIFSGTGAGTVEVDGAGVAPSAMTFTHGGGSVYFLTGGDIGASSSPAALALSGGGDLTLDNGMLYLGRVTVTDGALAFTDNAQVRLHDAAGIELSGGT